MQQGWDAWESLDGRADTAPPAGPVLLVGTRKGLWLVGADEDRSRWCAAGPMFLGHIIQHAVLDARDGRTLLAASRTGHLGPTVFRSIDLGRTWTEASRPPAFASPDPLERSLRAVFWLTPGHADEPGVWYAGGSRRACSAPRTAATRGHR